MLAVDSLSENDPQSRSHNKETRTTYHTTIGSGHLVCLQHFITARGFLPAQLLRNHSRVLERMARPTARHGAYCTRGLGKPFPCRHSQSNSEHFYDTDHASR